MDWKQRKWFDLYFKADEAYDALERFQVLYPDPMNLTTTEGKQEWNELMRIMRAVHRMAVVFPQNAAIDELLSATARPRSGPLPPGAAGPTGPGPRGTPPLGPTRRVAPGPAGRRPRRVVVRGRTGRAG